MKRFPSLSDAICYVCEERIGTRLACYDEKTKTGKGWRHCDCVQGVEETST